MAAWALGRIGGRRARAELEQIRRHADGMLLQEAKDALERLS
jgi:hypothetical protein